LPVGIDFDILPRSPAVGDALFIADLLQDGLESLLDGPLTVATRRDQVFPHGLLVGKPDQDVLPRSVELLGGERALVAALLPEPLFCRADSLQRDIAPPQLGDDIEADQIKEVVRRGAEPLPLLS
jgi:hypothetical protein